jgi:hypothetical protein
MMEPLARGLSIVAGCALILAGAPARADAIAPDSLSGLVAWYNTDSLHRHSRHRDTIDRWTDSSTKRRHLTAEWENIPPIFNTLQLNGKPVVRISRATHFDVAQPIVLDDHTIFLVYASEHTRRALFQNDSDPKHGLILGHEGRLHLYQNGKAGLFNYNDSTPLDLDYSITVLGREAGSLRAFVNGIDISSRIELPTQIRVGRFFHLEHTTHVTSDGEGLQIAQMIFYDRYLADDEREGVTRYLADLYGFDVGTESAVVRKVVTQEGEIAVDEAAVLVRLGTGTDINVNDDLVAVGWDVADKVEAPFRFDPEGANTELHCTRDGTRVRLTVALPLSTEIAEARVRALLLKNAEHYHPEEATTDTFGGGSSGNQAVLGFQTVVDLDAGDFVEVIATRAGAPGQVRIEPGEARLVVERVN